MAKTDFRSVDDYIRVQPKGVQPVLRRLRSVIRKAVPSAVEVISYQVPAYTLAGRPMLYFAAWKQHYSLYPASDELVAAFKGTLTSYRVSKGTLRFPLSEPVPATLIARVAKFRAREARHRARTKLAKKNSRKSGAGDDRSA